MRADRDERSEDDPPHLHRLVGAASAPSAPPTGSAGCDRRESRPARLEGTSEGRSPRARRSRPSIQATKPMTASSGVTASSAPGPASVDEVRVEAVRDDRGDEGDREDGQRGAFAVLGAPEGVAPEAREEHVRGQREQGARDPDGARRVRVQDEPFSTAAKPRAEAAA